MIASQSNIDVVWTWGASRSNESDEDFLHALDLARTSDEIVFVGGFDQSLEEEDTDRQSLR